MGRINNWLERHPEAGALTQTTTDSGIPVQIVYTSDDVSPGSEDRNGMPGEPPFGRGIYPTMYRGRPWTMRMYSGLETAVDTNRRFRFLLDQGQTGLSVAFDLPTQMGYDSDAPEARFEVGRTGVAACSVEDVVDIFAGIPLDEVSTSFTINATAPIVLAFYILAGERHGVPAAHLRGTIQNDILKEYIARKTYIFPPGPSLRFLTDAMEYCARELPRFNSVSVCGYHMRQAGADAVQEVAFTLSNALVYVQALVDRGVGIDDFAPRISFNLATMSDLFEEVAKHRACRRLWARLIRDRYAPGDERSLMMRFFSGGDGLSLTANEPLNNIVRVTIHQLGSILGGAQAMHAVGYDEAIGLPTEESALVALRTQQILATETGITRTVDPLAGSYYLEHLTDEIESRAEALIEEIEAGGGMLELIASGWIEEQIDRRAYEREMAIARGEAKIVGVNSHLRDDVAAPAFTLPSFGDGSFEQRQLDRLAAHRARRDGNAVQSALDQVHGDASDAATNLMPAVVVAARAGATVGEISDILRGVWGVFRR
ncbi:MAG TPA: methylmalonyl-CoA mutase family protein [Acidimicrobiia bacterium]|nr:methylmalonyl-CoA mutase family protein [Acidimicrobiia bacterium]